MEERVTTRAEFQEEVRRLAAELGEVVWEQVVEQGDTATADHWLREAGGAMLRGMLGAAWTARSERLGVSGSCECGGGLQFRQHQRWQVHTVLAGRDVSVAVQYGQCERCHRGWVPLLAEMRVDEKGFTEGLQELALLAGVMEPYQVGQEELLGRFAGVSVSVEKIERLVAQEGQRAERMLRESRAEERRAEGTVATGPCYVGIDGGMIFVQGRWQEAKLGCIYQARDRVELSARRTELVARQVVAIRGEPAALGARLWPRAQAAGIDERREVVVLGDGAPWIWHLVAEHFPHRVEILDWYHAKEHVSATARILYGEATERTVQWRKEQLDRLWDDRVEDVIAALRFLGAPAQCGQAPGGRGPAPLSQHQPGTHALSDLPGSGLPDRQRGSRERHRTRRPAAHEAGGHALGASGADAMLALRSVYRSIGAWGPFWQARAAA